MSSPKALREYLAPAMRCIEDAGATVLLDPTRKHLKLTVVLGDQTRSFFSSKTSSDARAGKNFATDVRRGVREMQIALTVNNEKENA
jgi:hypothetical protein